MGKSSIEYEQAIDSGRGLDVHNDKFFERIGRMAGKP